MRMSNAVSVSTAMALSAAVIASASVTQAATFTCGLPGGGTCVGSISSTVGAPLTHETEVFLLAATGTTFTANAGGILGPSLVNLTANTTVRAASGSGTLTAGTSPFLSLLVSVPSGFGFTDLSFSTFGNTDLTVTGSNGGIFTITGLGLDLNPFVITALGGSFFTSVLLTSSSLGFTLIKDIQLSGLTTVATPAPGPIPAPGPTPSPVPIPGALVLFGSGLLGLGLLARRKLTALTV